MWKTELIFGWPYLEDTNCHVLRLDTGFDYYRLKENAFSSKDNSLCVILPYGIRIEFLKCFQISYRGSLLASSYILCLPSGDE